MAQSPSSSLRPTTCEIPKGIHQKEQLWLQECRNTVRGYVTTWLWGSTKSRKERVRLKDGNDWLVIHWMKRWDGSCRRRGLTNIYSWSPSLSPLSRNTRTPPSRGLYQSSLSLCTAAIAQSSAKLIGSGGEKRIFPPKLLPGPFCEAQLSSSIPYNYIPKPERT